MTLLAKWNYGNPTAEGVDSDTWRSWLDFINIVACPRPRPGVDGYIYTDWSNPGSVNDNDLIGWATDKMELVPPEGPEGFDAMSTVDWRIQTHRDLIPIAWQVMTRIKGIQQHEHQIKATITEAIKGLF